MRFVVLRKIKVILGALLITLFTLSLVVFPAEGVRAAVAGLRLFWEVVLPSLLPFFVLSEIMLGMGVVHFLGVLLEPLMRPLFNVPGVGAFALSMGLAAGYPMDAVITGKFRRSGLCSRSEGERLLSFTNTADPLFIFGAVAVGMFGRPELGATLAIAHYISSFTVGVVFKFYQKDGGVSVKKERESLQPQMLRRAVRALFKARRDDGRPIGRLLGDAVKDSITTLLMIGGFIVLFAVLVKMFDVFQVMKMITPVLGGLLQMLGIAPGLAGSVFNGILEIDLGTVAASQAVAPMADKMMIASWIIAWSGLSVHAQVASVIQDTDIRMTPYVIARFLHGIFAAVYTWLLMGPLAPVLAPVVHSVVAAGRTFNPVERVVFSGRQILLILGILLLCSLAIYFSKRYRLVHTKQCSDLS